jgi:hypothetical protein
METSQQVKSNYDQQQLFDKETMQKIQASLEEIDKKKQFSEQTSAARTRYIKFTYDKECKRLSFTGRFDKQRVPEKNFETGQILPDKFVTRYSFECYDVTATTTGSEEENSKATEGEEPSIWERGTKDARTILYYLSKNKNLLEVTRNGAPGSKTTTYQINPPLD